LSGSATFQITVQANPFPWHNPALPEDVDGDGIVKPLDALRAVNDYNLHGMRELGPRPARPGQTPLFLDVFGDAFFTPQDIHQIITFLNAAVASAAEGEAYAPLETPEPLRGRSISFGSSTAIAAALQLLPPASFNGPARFSSIPRSSRLADWPFAATNDLRGTGPWNASDRGCDAIGHWAADAVEDDQLLETLAVDVDRIWGNDAAGRLDLFDG
jgi:hypothetical protein